MLPLYLDFNPYYDASTTLNREQTEYRIHAIPTSFDQDLTNMEEFRNGHFISVLTNLSLSNQQPLVYTKESPLLDDDFDIISKFKFKNSKRIKARLKKTTYSPSIVFD